MTELDVEALAVLNASTNASAASVPTSATPTDIAINSQGTIAYVTGEDGPNMIEHAHWGRGTVVRKEGGRLVVLFETAGYKTLDMDTATAGGVIETVE